MPLTHLEDVRDVSQVEDVVETDSSGQKVLVHFLVKTDGGLDESPYCAAHPIAIRSLLKVTAQYITVDCGQSLSTWEVHSKN